MWDETYLRDATGPAHSHRLEGMLERKEEYFLAFSVVDLIQGLEPLVVHLFGFD